jgi:diazepam-binding inhibitor (GABA receptor modulator, acyl-CoA-binding protein)
MRQKVDTFETATSIVEQLAPRLKGVNNDVLLKLYGLYKQSTIGDNNTNKPGILDPKGLAKWNAWNQVKNMNSIEAKQRYIDLVNSEVLL